MKKSAKKEIKISRSLEETFSFGFSLGQKCEGGEVFLLNGDLGAGKTSLLQGLGAGLGVKDKINSPSFNILKLYKGRKLPSSKKTLTFCHIDAYRLKSGKDLENIGISDYLEDKNTIVAIEWAERVKSIQPKNRIDIELSVKNQTERKISLMRVSD